MPYIGKKPADIIATAVDTTTGTFSGVVDADAGITVDNITIDGQEIDVSSGDFTLDVAGDINLDSDSGYVLFKDGGTEHARIFQNNSGDVNIGSQISEKDMKFNGNDGGVAITALTLDMSAAGAATFNSTVAATGINFAGDRAINNTNDTAYNIRTSSGSGSHYFGSGRTGFSGGIEIAKLSTTGTVFNDGSADLDFRVESDGNVNAIFVDAGANQLGIGQTPDIASNGHYFHFGPSDGENAHLVLVNTLTDGNGTNLFINRQGSDGDLVNFRQANSLEGRIFVSGSTVTYAGFSGQHESSGIATNTAVGTVVSTIDELDTYPSTQSDTLGDDETHPKAGQTRADHPKVKISDTVGDACVYGVVAEFSKQDKVMIASVGIGSVRVTGACSKGDLLESNGDGTAKVQSDDIIRNKTIGKVTIGNSTTDVKLVSCVLYCG